MIHEATGKFSSRCVLPDLRSLALLIKLHRHWSCADRARNSRPHIGEYAGKTNAFAGRRLCGRRLWNDRRQDLPGRFAEKRGLLAVGLQHLVAGGRNFRAVFLQAGKDHKIALVDDAAAVALNVAAAGRLLLLRALALLRLLLL